MKEGVNLGGALNRLFRGKSPLSDSAMSYGIMFPGPKKRGTGNIIIGGRPGTGKSTLGLQIAVRAAIDGSNAAYISLEEGPEAVRAKASDFGWERFLYQPKAPASTSIHDLSEQLGKLLKTGVKAIHGESWKAVRAYSFDKKDKYEWRLDALSAYVEHQYDLTLARSRAAPSNLEETKSRAKLLRQDQNIIRESLGKVRVARQAKWDKTRNAVNNALRRIAASFEPSHDRAGCVYLPSLSPRSISTSREGTDFLFAERYSLLEKLVSASASLIERGDPAAPRLVVLDSLNMFSGSEMPGREELFRIFDLFKRARVIGVFLVETSIKTRFDSTMADVVVSLTSSKDQGYFVRYVELKKSRNARQTYGLHPYKVQDKEESSHRGETGIIVYPSVHTVIADTEKRQARSSKEPFDFVSAVVMKRLLRMNLPRQSVITIEGPSGTFKTTLAINFLAGGLRKGENVLFLRLKDPSSYESVVNVFCFEEFRQPPISLKADDVVSSSFALNNYKPDKSEDSDLAGALSDIGGRTKASVSVLSCASDKTRGVARDSNGKLVLVDFKTGALLPEEFVQIVRQICFEAEEKGQRIRRVVLDDVSLIGVSYPFLRHSRTTKDLFLSAFVHVMRNLGVDLVITGTSGELGEANDPVNRACALADAVLSCRFLNVFGQRHVMLSGDGLVGQRQTRPDINISPESLIGFESVPAVLRIVDPKEKTLKIDGEFLQGLVGFETGEIRRPGVTVYLYEENQTVHKGYNDEIKSVMSGLFAYRSPITEELK